jgi:TATA-binding protein-associated factor
VTPHLQSRSFETRQAAASALSHISRAVGIWDPSSTAPSSSSSELPPPTIDDELAGLRLHTFDVGNVLAEGSLLLSSSGNEYAKLSNLSADELAKAQKDALGKLGLGFGAGTEDDLGVDVGAELAAGAGVEPDTNLASVSTLPPPRPVLPPPKSALPPPKFKNEGSDNSTGSIRTLSASATPPVAGTSALPTPVVPSSSIPPAPTEEVQDLFAGLSARERNKLKRKRKTDAKSGGGGALNAPPPPPAKVRVVEAPGGGARTKATAKALAIPPPAEATSVKGEVVVIDPGAKAREKEREGGEVRVDLGAKDRAEMEVKVGEWPWRGTVERLAVGLLS